MGELQTLKSILESETVIKSNENFIGMGLWNIGNELKYIRDNKTYSSKGYSGFEEYVKKELDYGSTQTYSFIAIADKYSLRSSEEMGHLGIKKLYELSKLNEPERETFIKENPVNEMTTRQLQQAIREKKEIERQLETEKNKPIIEKIVEKQVFPSDYHQLKGNVANYQSKLKQNETTLKRLEEDKQLLERKVKLNADEAKKYTDMKKQVDFLYKQKNDLSRQIESATELAKLTVSLHSTLKTELAPIKFSRCIEQLSQSDTALKNLVEIIEMVESWTDEIRGYLPNKNIINVEEVF